MKRLLPVIIGTFIAAASAFADGGLPYSSEKVSTETAEVFKDVGIEEHLGSKINLDLQFNDEQGRRTPLRHYFESKKPIMLSLVYFSCPNLCNLHLNGMTDMLKTMSAPIGSDFDYVVVSIDPREDAVLATAKKESYLKAYGRPESASGWHFLTGTQESISQLASQVGFQYKWDEKQKQYSHASAAYVLTPEGMISRYLYGVAFAEKDVRLALAEASSGRIGTVMEKLIMFCFRYDPAKRTYSLYVYNIMRAGGGLTLLVLGTFLFSFWFRQRKKSTEIQGVHS